MIHISPSKSEFIRNAKAGDVSPVYAGLPFISPRRIYENFQSAHSFLLESIKGPEKIARYSFIGAGPFLIFRVKDGNVEVEDRRKGSGVRPESTRAEGQGSGITGAPLKKLKELLSAHKIKSPENLPPFVGGAVGLISYDFVRYFENIPGTAVDDLNIPDAHFMLFDSVIAVDRKLQKTFLMSCPLISADAGAGLKPALSEWEDAYDRACEKIKIMFEKISLIPSTPPAGAGLKPVPANTPIHIRHEMGKEAYMEIVKRAKEYIRAGDIFQANLSQRVSADIGDIGPWQIYKILSGINPSPFAAYLDLGQYHIASSSPERLVKVTGRIVETRPIAGTRPRGKDAEGDFMMRKDLLLNEKERAEHLMLIDLERNDLGKISGYSTVEVDEFMITEDYSHVIHIVSNIRGALANGKDCFDAIRATFPGGTITGVPKVRCMEIIDELEPVARGPYTGSVGYISFTGDMDLNIVIRTFVIKDKVAYVQAGAGIVADSDPEREYLETLKKAEALVRTLETL
ncbi:MAG: anthranilate synthase component I family protein [Nitrospiraceae bacterium]|nr:MAG: anthranilate synthase component I family protein [Nitrospiraceae bacterium]